MSVPRVTVWVYVCVPVCVCVCVCAGVCVCVAGGGGGGRSGVYAGESERDGQRVARAQLSDGQCE